MRLFRKIVSPIRDEGTELFAADDWLIGASGSAFLATDVRYP
jgi:hypothetical protein